LTLQLDYH